MEEKQTSVKTLKTAKEAAYFGKKMVMRARSAVDEGRPVVWAMYDLFMVSSILKAMGAEIIYPENYGAFCAAMGAAPGYIDAAVSEGFPTTLCGYATNSLGYTRRLMENDFVIPPDAPAGGIPKPSLLIGREAMCDAGYKWFQALGRYMNVPVWVLPQPQPGSRELFLKGYKEEIVQYMYGEIKGFIGYAEKLLNRKLDSDDLSERVDTIFKTLKMAYEVDRLRLSVPSPMVSQDFWACMLAHYFSTDEKEAVEFYKKVYDEVKYRVDNKIGAVANEKYRMMFSDLPPWHTLKFFDDLGEKHGIAFVKESYAYHVPSPLPEEEVEGVNDPVELIVRLAFHMLNEHAHVGRDYDIDPLICTAAFLEWAKEYRADGLMGHLIISCHPATYTILHVGNLLMDKVKVPSVFIEGDIVDTRLFNIEEANAKMDAFVETMDHYREVRKKEGLDW